MTRRWRVVCLAPFFMTLRSFSLYVSYVVVVVVLFAGVSPFLLHLFLIFCVARICYRAAIGS